MNDDNELDIVVLAAGQSSRFEGDKLQLTLPYVLDLLKHFANFRQLIVVCDVARSRYLDKLLIQYIHPAKYQLVCNPEPEAGMAGSIAIAVNLLQPGRLAIIPGDMPFINIATLELMARQSGRKYIVVPEYHGQRGHPVIFGSDFYPELQTLTGDIGARQVIERHRSKVKSIATDEKGILLDIDTREDWQKLSPLLPAAVHS